MKEQLITLPKIVDKRGNLSVIEDDVHIPFRIARVYWIYDVPGGQKRGSHAFRNQQEVIFALSGSFTVFLDDGKTQQTLLLNKSNVGVYVPSRTWRYLDEFTTNSLCLVLASSPYSKDEYIRNYRDFKKLLAEDHKVEHLPQPEKNTHLKIENLPSPKTVFDCNLIEFPMVRNRAGNLTSLNNFENIPFEIERVFYVYDIPSGETRGGHAHRYCHEILIAASGSFDVEIDDGVNKRTITLNRPMVGLHLPPGIWAVEKNYSSGAICLVLSSHKYDEHDYLRKYSDFKEYRADADHQV